MSFQIRVETPDHERAQTWIESRNITFDDLERVMQDVAFEALNSMRSDLAGHIRTGLTIESLLIDKIAQSADSVTLFVGSYTRGSQLRWLDRGRGEVRPVTAKKLRWLTWPEGVLIFSMYSRPTVGIGLIQRAAESAISQVPTIIEKQIGGKT